MKRRLVFGLAVAMVMVAIGGAVAEAGDVFKAPSFPNVTALNAWLVLQPFAAALSVSTQGALVAPCEEETCTASNTFLLLVFAIDPAGTLFVNSNWPHVSICRSPKREFNGKCQHLSVRS